LLLDMGGMRLLARPYLEIAVWRHQG